MPQWAGSSWYFLRYVDNKNDKELVSKEKADKYLPVDMYIGGVEHASVFRSQTSSCHGKIAVSNFGITGHALIEDDGPVTVILLVFWNVAGQITVC